MPPDHRLVTVPFDTRIYVSPSGERCRLVVALVKGPWPEPWWAVELLNDEGMSPISGVPAIVHVQSRERARGIYRARMVALKAAGWRRA